MNKNTLENIVFVLIVVQTFVVCSVLLFYCQLSSRIEDLQRPKIEVQVNTVPETWVHKNSKQKVIITENAFTVTDSKGWKFDNPTLCAVDTQEYRTLNCGYRSELYLWLLDVGYGKLN